LAALNLLIVHLIIHSSIHLFICFALSRVLKANLKFEDVEKEAKVDLGGTRLYDSVLDALTTMEREAAGASGKTILYNLICFTGEYFEGGDRSHGSGMRAWNTVVKQC
jgi:hypothetical protein